MFMSIRVHFAGGKRVDADLGEHVVNTDQSHEHGGDGTAPEPFDLFLASFPAKYRLAVERAAGGCKVKKTLIAPPEYVVTARNADAA
jgi:hypothetical protein